MGRLARSLAGLVHRGVGLGVHAVMDALLVGALEALQDEVAVPVGLVAEPRLLAWRDRAVAHDFCRVGRVRGGALVAVGAPAPGVRAALSLAALRLDRVLLSRALRWESCASVGPSSFLLPPARFGGSIMP